MTLKPYTVIFAFTTEDSIRARLWAQFVNAENRGDALAKAKEIILRESDENNEDAISAPVELSEVMVIEGCDPEATVEEVE